MNADPVTVLQLMKQLRDQGHPTNCKISPAERQKRIDSLEFSANNSRLEGCEPEETPEALTLLLRYINGEISPEAYWDAGLKIAQEEALSAARQFSQ